MEQHNNKPTTKEVDEVIETVNEMMKSQDMVYLKPS